MHNHNLGISGLPAPELKGVTWLTGVPSGADLRLSDITEPLIYLYCFQSWCPGCHAHGFPTMAAVKRHVEQTGRADLVRFIAVQTVFEGHGTNTVEAARSAVARHDLSDITLGHIAGEPPALMSTYRTGGTPWTVLIGPGEPRRVLADGFHAEAESVISLINEIDLAESDTPTLTTIQGV